MLMLAALFDYRNLELLAPPAFFFFWRWWPFWWWVSTRVVRCAGSASAARLVQPTEVGKFLLIIFMAWYLSWFHDRMHRLPYLLPAVLLLIFPLALVYLQPDLGMTVTLAFLGGTLLLVGGIRFGRSASWASGALAVVPFLWGTLQGYMLERIEVFLNPQGNPDAAFNINQAMIAVGSGGWLGRGWGLGSQNQLHFLRVRHTDFIFSVIAEELGLVGSHTAILMLLFLCDLATAAYCRPAQDHFGRLIATGVAALIFFPGLCQCRYESEPGAGDRPDTAICQLWRQQSYVDDVCYRSGRERGHALSQDGVLSQHTGCTWSACRQTHGVPLDTSVRTRTAGVCVSL